jgi:hypothetical protein
VAALRVERPQVERAQVVRPRVEIPVAQLEMKVAVEDVLLTTNSTEMIFAKMCNVVVD